MVSLAVLGWRVIRQGALVRAWGYAERETDLYIKAGIFWRRLTGRPCSRPHAGLLEVTAGPLERAFNPRHGQAGQSPPPNRTPASPAWTRRPPPDCVTG